LKTERADKPGQGASDIELSGCACVRNEWSACEVVVDVRDCCMYLTQMYMLLIFNKLANKSAWNMLDLVIC
jgi:hypothetical protein